MRKFWLILAHFGSFWLILAHRVPHASPLLHSHQSQGHPGLGGQGTQGQLWQVVGQGDGWGRCGDAGGHSHPPCMVSCMVCTLGLRFGSSFRVPQPERALGAPQSPPTPPGPPSCSPGLRPCWKLAGGGCSSCPYSSPLA